VKSKSDEFTQPSTDCHIKDELVQVVSDERSVGSARQTPMHHIMIFASSDSFFCTTYRLATTHTLQTHDRRHTDRWTDDTSYHKRDRYSIYGRLKVSCRFFSDGSSRLETAASSMHQIVCRLGLRPRPHWGSLQRSPDPLAGFIGPYF